MGFKQIVAINRSNILLADLQTYLISPETDGT